MRGSLISKMRIGVASLVGLIALVACTTTVEETGRKQFNILDPKEEAAMGLSEFERYKRSKPISSNSTYNAMVDRVASRLTRVIDLPNAEWEFVVFADSTPNAFALPGGKVGIHSGLFKVVQNDAQLAAVIGHEVGHVTARHSGERVSNAIAGAAVGAVVGEILSRETGMKRSTAQGVTQGAATLRLLKFSRKQELEADQLGAIYMARAGYDPRQSIALWQNFARYKDQMGAGRVPVFLNTHPLDDRRIQELERFMPKAMRIYERSSS